MTISAIAFPRLRRPRFMGEAARMAALARAGFGRYRARLEAVPARYAAAGAGALAGLSTYYGGLLIADCVLFALAAAYWRRPQWWAWALAVPVALSAGWADAPWYPVWTGARLVALSVLFARFQGERRMMAAGFFVLLIGQAAVLPWLIDGPRPSAFAANASVLGHAGFAAFVAVGAGGLWWGLLGAIEGTLLVGASASRTALAMLLIFGAFQRPRLVIYALPAVVAVMLIAAAASGTDLARWTWAGVLNTFGTRTELAVAQPDASAPELEDFPGRAQFLEQKAFELARREAGVKPKDFGGGAPVTVTPAHFQAVRVTYPYTKPELSWLGYGYGSFVVRTNVQAPHIVPVLAIFELGILALPVFGVVGWALWRRKIPLALALAVGAAWLSTEEHWSSGAGHYMLAFMLAVGSQLHPRKPLDGEGDNATHKDRWSERVGGRLLLVKDSIQLNRFRPLLKRAPPDHIDGQQRQHDYRVATQERRERRYERSIAVADDELAGQGPENGQGEGRDEQGQGPDNPALPVPLKGRQRQRTGERRKRKAPGQLVATGVRPDRKAPKRRKARP